MTLYVLSRVLRCVRKHHLATALLGGTALCIFAARVKFISACVSHPNSAKLPSRIAFELPDSINTSGGLAYLAAVCGDTRMRV